MCYNPPMNANPGMTKTACPAEAPARLQAPDPIPMTDNALEAARNNAQAALRKRRNRKKYPRLPPAQASQQRRRRVIQAVMRKWAELGTIGTSIRTVALETGASPNNLHNLLGRREELLAEIMVNHVSLLSERVYAAAHATAGARTVVRLEAILVAFLTCATKEAEAHHLLHHALIGLAAPGREEVRRRYRLVLEVVAEPLRELAPAAQDKRVMALALAAVGAMGDALLWFDPMAEMDVVGTAARLTTMLLAAVGASGGLGPRPGCGGPVAACARAWLAGRVG